MIDPLFILYIKGQSYWRKMKISELFKDSNDINEKSVVGFGSFTIMSLFAAADILTGAFGADLVINEFVYNSFVIITLGSFGIGDTIAEFTKVTGLDKIAERVAKAAGKEDCGCNKRRETLNKKFPYKQ